MDNNTFEAALPFPGFYQSYIAQALDDEIDYVLDDVDADKADTLREKYYDRMDYSKAYTLIATDYAAWLTQRLYDALDEDGLHPAHLPNTVKADLVSPREYNFTSDVIWVDLPIGFLPTPQEFSERHLESCIITKLIADIKAEYSSRDGFISFVPSVADQAMLDGKFDEAHPWHNSTYLRLLCEYYFSSDDVLIQYELENDFLDYYAGNGYFLDVIAKCCKDYDDLVKEIESLRGY